MDRNCLQELRCKPVGKNRRILPASCCWTVLNKFVAAEHCLSVACKVVAEGYD